MKCLLCGRELKNKKSIEIKHGRTCAMKLGLIKPKTIKYKNKYRNKTLMEIQ